MDVVQAVSLFSVLILCCVTDIWSHRIPNMFILTGLAFRGIGLCAGILAEGLGVVPEALWAMAVFAGCCVPLYLLRMTGAGDVKLLGMIGFYIGLKRYEHFLVGMLVTGGILAFCKLIRHKRFRKRLQYLWTYMKGVCLTGQLKAYGIPDEKEEVMGLAVPMLGGVVYWYISK